MEKIKLLVVDDNVNLVHMIEEYFKNDERISVDLTSFMVKKDLKKYLLNKMNTI